MILERSPGGSEPRGAGGAHISLSPLASEVASALRRRRRLALFFVVLGLCALVVLAVHGGTYYLLSPAERLSHSQDRALRPSGIWGHGVGVVATFVMLLNFLYPLRKRSRRMHRMGAVPTWLVFHVGVGILAPLMILFHAAFRFNNLISTFTYGSLIVVVATGIIGRFIYSMVPGAGELRSGELDDLRRSWEALVEEVRVDLGKNTAPAWLGRLLEPPVPARNASPARALGAVLAWPAAALRAHTAARFLSRRLTAERGGALRTAVDQMVRLRLQIAFFGGIKRLLSTWRFGHSLLALFLVVVIILHVAVGIAFGYRWIF